MRIMYVASEAIPFAKTGGLADVLGALPKAVRRLGHDTVVVLPRYRDVKAKTQVISSLTVPMGHPYKFCSILEPERDGSTRFFLVDYPPYYDREALYRVLGQDFPDNAERFALLSWAALEFAKRAPQAPDLIHCNDWQTALIPVYLKTIYREDPFFARTKTLLTIHNLAYQGVFPGGVLPKVSLPGDLFHPEMLEFYGNVNFLKGGLVFADWLSTVSRKYSQEIQTPELGCGLEGVLVKRSRYLSGILNGVDYSQWNPLTDSHIAANYSPENLAGKKLCKLELIREFGLEAVPDRPLIAIISRLADQKGFDLLSLAADAIVQEGVSLVVLGVGEERYRQFFLDLQEKYPLSVGAKIMHDDRLAHRIEAGADMFLMPSRFEPCGLNQIYSLKYGTVPLVRATGGLDDTIVDYSESSGANGFKFNRYSAEELLSTVQRAIQVYRDPKAWQSLMKCGMHCDFSWDHSAKEYVELYSSILQSRQV
jgi:starch synthase